MNEAEEVMAPFRVSDEAKREATVLKFALGEF